MLHNHQDSSHHPVGDDVPGTGWAEPACPGRTFRLESGKQALCVSFLVTSLALVLLLVLTAQIPRASASVTVPATRSHDGKPDLRVAQVYFDDDRPSDGDTVEIYALIENAGAGDANSSFVVNFEADEDIDIDRVRVGSLKQGENTTVQVSWDTFFQFYGEGDHEVRVMVDYNNDVDESNETNNERSQLIYFKHWWDRNDPTPGALLAFSIAGILVFIALIYHPIQDYLRSPGTDSFPSFLRTGGQRTRAGEGAPRVKDSGPPDEEETKREGEGLERPRLPAGTGALGEEKDEDKKLVVVQNIKEYYAGGRVDIKDSVLTRTTIDGVPKTEPGEESTAGNDASGEDSDGGDV